MQRFTTPCPKPARVRYTNVDTLQTTTTFTFPAQYERIRVPQSFDEISEDGRWLGGTASRNDGVQVLLSLDLQDLTIDLLSGSSPPTVFVFLPVVLK